MKATNSASPTLFKSCATGVHIKKATLTVRRRARTRRVPQDQPPGHHRQLVEQKADGDVPLDSFSLSFADITFTQTPQNPDVSLG